MLAAWFGPTKLATAILFATITNIVAYLPFLMVSGTSGEFLYSLPVVLACSLVATRPWNLIGSFRQPRPPSRNAV